MPSLIILVSLARCSVEKLRLFMGSPLFDYTVMRIVVNTSAEKDCTGFAF
jgi:hypothetical protein